MIMRIFWTFRSAFSAQFGPIVSLSGPYLTALTLIPQLSDGPHTHEVFTQACQGLSEMSVSYPLAPFLLRAVKTVGTQCKAEFPEAAIKYLEGHHASPAVEPQNAFSEIGIPTSSNQRTSLTRAS